MSVPNQLTVLRIVLTPVIAVTFLFKLYILKYVSLVIFILASLTDWYDGHFARKYGKITPVGKYLDPLADKLLVSTAFGMFAFSGYIDMWIFWVIVSRDVIVTGLRSYALYVGKPFNTSMLAKWKTAIQMGAIYFIFFWIIARETYVGTETALPALMQKIESWNLIYSVMLCVTAYTVFSGMTYLYENRQHLKGMAIAFYRVFVPTNVR